MATCQACYQEFEWDDDNPPRYCAECQRLADEAARDEKVDQQREDEWLGE
jgi:hypothetical protein